MEDRRRGLNRERINEMRLEGGGVQSDMEED